MAMENAQRASTGNLLGPLSILTYGARGEPLGVETLCRCPVKPSLVVLFNLCHIDAHFFTNVVHDAGSPSYPFCSRYHSLSSLMTRLPIMVKFCIVAHSKL